MFCSSSRPLLALAGFAAVAQAHFTLDYPLTRGFDDNMEPLPACGGFTNVTSRTPFPLTNGQIQIGSHHPSATIEVLISFDAVPNNNTQFTSNPLLVNSTSITGEGEFCFVINPADAVPQMAKNNTNATLQVSYANDVHGQLYQCADITLVSSATSPSNFTGGACANATKAAAFPSGISSGDDDGTASGSGSSGASGMVAGSSLMATTATAVLGAVAVGGLAVLL